MTLIFAIILTIAILLCASLLLVLISYPYTGSQHKKLRAEFRQAARALNLSLTRQTVLGKRMIGLDIVQNKLLVGELRDNHYHGHLVDLRDIKKCAVRKEYGWVVPKERGRSRAETYVTGIALQLDYKKRTLPLVIPFYEESSFSMFELPEQEAQAREWDSLLSAQLVKIIDAAGKRKNSFVHERIDLLEDSIFHEATGRK